MKLRSRLIAIILTFVLVCAPLLPQKAVAAEEVKDGYMTLEEAGEYVRKELAAQKTDISVKFWFESPYVYADHELLEILQAEAFRHTGISDEGDYLRWTFQTVGYDAEDAFDGKTHYVTFQYITPTYNNTAEQEQELDEKLRQVMAELDLDGKTDYEKVEAIYKYVCENVRYSEEVLSSGADPVYPPEELQVYYSAYGALVLNSATCQGFSSLIYRMMLEAGIDCRLIAGDIHGWNIVKLDDKYYYLDATWGSGALEAYGELKWFLNGSASFRVDGHKAYVESFDTEFLDQYPISVLDYGAEEPAVDTVLGSGKCGDNVTWKLTGDGKLTISGSGAMWDADPSGVLWLVENLPDRWDNLSGYIRSVEIQKGVTSVGDYAFYNCPRLTDVSLANSVKTIGSWSFALCEGLTQIVIPNTVKEMEAAAFYQCPRLETVTLSAGMKRIPEKAFVGCTSLKTVTIPDGIKTIGESAFATCPGLESVSIPASVTTLENGVFSGSFDPAAKVSFTVPETVTAVGTGCFEDTGLREVIWNAKTDTVESAMFNLSIYLENVEFCDAPTIFAEWLFHDCYNLKSVTLPSGLTEVGAEAFQNCFCLESVTLPDTLTAIPSRMFNGCKSLSFCPIPDSIKSIGMQAFADCKALNTIIIPASVEEIGISAFFVEYGETVIIFQGDAPLTVHREDEMNFPINYSANRKVTIYYPADNETWDDSIKNLIAPSDAPWKAMHPADAEHTPGEKGFDAENHWDTCTGCLEKMNAESHIYSSDCDGSCDICGAMRKVTHNIRDEWVANEQEHWKACACGLKESIQTHRFDAGITEGDQTTYSCTVCGFEKTEANETEPTNTPSQDPGNNSEIPEDNNKTDDNGSVVIIVAIAAILIVGGAAVIVILKKKKASP